MNSSSNSTILQYKLVIQEKRPQLYHTVYKRSFKHTPLARYILVKTITHSLTQKGVVSSLTSAGFFAKNETIFPFLF